ncbi:MAG: hypothetical protein HY593_03540 [Candidatus Omnitrophica bacterium]|nr:hypothetical protein [Candidatus Omnitrophota bacterium]
MKNGFGGRFTEKIGIAAGVALPLFNIPLIAHLWRTKSSKDFSLLWALGVWACALLMTPQALRSRDSAFKIFGCVNLVLFSAVAFLIVKYHRKF